MALVWIGFLELLKKDSKYKRFTIVLTILATLSFMAAILSQLIVTQTETIRYVGLVSYPLLCISASIGLMVLSKKEQVTKRSILSVIVLLFIISGVASPLVSPDLWQDVGQGHYAAVNRVVGSTTIGEEAGQNFLNKYDNNYYVMSNYHLQFINIVNPQNGLEAVSGAFYEVGYAEYPIGGEHVVLVSFRAVSDGISKSHFAH